MSMILERVQTEGIAELSYVIGDDATGTVAVIDPRADVEVYLEIARRRKLSITHIFETHIHADLVSGACELRARARNAAIFVSVEGDAEYSFDHEEVRDGDQFEFGSVVLTARHTPGHTPEHMVYEASEKKRAPTPFAVFTGDALFVNSAGRPDLLGSGEAKELAGKLYDTLYDYFLKLDDEVIIFPAHGAGSPCGASIGDRLESAIGYERRFNPFLQYHGREEFKEYALSTAPPEPTYYQRMKKLNARGPEVLGNLPGVSALPPEAFQAALENSANIVLDTRHMLAYGGGHIRGALNFGNLPELSIWAGWLLDPESPLLLILDSDDDIDQVVRLLLRTGFCKYAGYLVGGMTAWDNAGLPLEETDQVTVHQLKSDADRYQIIDVRTPEEWEGGRIPGAKHLFLPEVEKRSDELDRANPVAVYCNSGYRASIGASLLQKRGFDVHNIPGSWQAWTNADYPVEK
ncbi:Beta-lactamase hydrolase-like protein [Botrimarina colliarenosi]|uniref:Beta-lactamase hydrolase-like protein n=1 Tax=Botrimarina colliarenosi TaxID=2528001 RepID=A0A5C6A641_9BACT|nr:MBL fold metallo-hydrolase [Botrimarina colliarenosi]TWT94850.1 Beta-lactamase hydrolase-like protein [Botrimarina colliarenosi]